MENAWYLAKRSYSSRLNKNIRKKSRQAKHDPDLESEPRSTTPGLASASTVAAALINDGALCCTRICIMVSKYVYEPSENPRGQSQCRERIADLFKECSTGNRDLADFDLQTERMHKPDDPRVVTVEMEMKFRGCLIVSK